MFDFSGPLATTYLYPAICVLLLATAQWQWHRWRVKRMLREMQAGAERIAQVRRVGTPRVADPQKRKTLQPGTEAQAEERMDAVGASAESRMKHPRDVLRLRDPVGVVHELEPTGPFMAPPVPAPVTQDETKRRHLQPHGEDQAALEKRATLADQGFSHRFFGSQLIVGSVTLVRNLSKGVHVMEITANNQLFIDNNPYAANPSDLIRVKEELAKLRQ